MKKYAHEVSGSTVRKSKKTVGIVVLTKKRKKYAHEVSGNAVRKSQKKRLESGLRHKLA